MKILVIASWFPKNANDTNGSFVLEQVELLTQLGHEVTVLHPTLKGTFMKTLTSRKTEFSKEVTNNIQVIHISIPPTLPKMRAANYKKLAKKCLKIVRELNIEFDVIHAHAMFMGGVIAQKLSKKMMIPFVHTEHTSGLIFDTNQYTKKDISSMKKVYSEAKKVIFVSQFFMNEMIKQHQIEASNCIVINNLVHPAFFQAEIKTDLKPFRYLFIGRLTERKNVTLLIHSFGQVVKSSPFSELTIAGEGIMKKELISLAEDLKVESQINWLSNLSRSEVLTQMTMHNVILSASRIETFGLTIAESIATGTPVITTDSGGVRDIVVAENGLIVENTPEVFGQAMVEVQKEYARFNREEIRKGAFDKFSSQIIGNQINEVLKSATGISNQ